MSNSDKVADAGDFQHASMNVGGAFADGHRVMLESDGFGRHALLTVVN